MKNKFILMSVSFILVLILCLTGCGQINTQIEPTTEKESIIVETETENIVAVATMPSTTMEETTTIEESTTVEETTIIEEEIIEFNIEETEEIIIEDKYYEEDVEIEEYIEEDYEAPTSDYIEEPIEETYEEVETYGGSVLTPGAGINYYNGILETYYNLPMGGVLDIMYALGYDYEYWVRDDGCKMFGPYIMVAADFGWMPRGSIVETSLGTGMVCDTGAGGWYWFDIAVTW